MSDREYEVGYGRPPKHTQFKKGQTGNPKGRKKGARGFKTDLKAEMNARVEITENGKKAKVTKQQLLVKQLTTKALKGDVRAISKLSDMVIALLGVEDEVKGAKTGLPAEDKAILAAWSDRQIEALLDD